MKFLLPTILAAALLLGTVAIAQEEAAIVVDPAIASMTNGQLVEARQDAMKQNGQALRGAARLTGEPAVAAATTLLQNFTIFPALFREGSTGDGSKALPSVWENWDDFAGRFEKDAASAAKMLAAAKSGDTAAFAAAAEEIDQSCGSCHMTYRGR